jgi:cytochrome c553
MRRAVFVVPLVALALTLPVGAQAPAPRPQNPPPAAAGTPARAADADRNGKAAAIAAGRKAAEFCANCHGADGNSKSADVPNLAGQNRVYLLAQLQKFATGERRNAFMEGLIKLLPPADLPLIATYFSESAVAPLPPAAKGTPADGRVLFLRYCTECHGTDAYGKETVPRLAGQQADYLRVSIRRYRDRTGERLFAPMSAVTGALKDADIDNLVAYLNGLR